MSVKSVEDDKLSDFEGPSPQPLSSNKHGNASVMKNNSASFFRNSTFAPSTVIAPRNSSMNVSRGSFRLRAVSSMQQGRGAAFQSVRSMRVLSEAVGDLFVPRVKWDWKQEMEAGGKELSICAFISAFSFTVMISLIFLYFFGDYEGYFGEAKNTFDTLAKLEDLSIPIFIASGALLFFLYVFDFFFSEGNIRILGFFLLVCGLSLCLVGILFLTGAAITAPVSLFFIMVPVILLVLKRVIFTRVDVTWYMLSVACALLVLAIGVSAMFAFWVFTTDNFWVDFDVQTRYLEIVGCNVSLAFAVAAEDFLDKDADTCPDAFVIYILPIVVAVYSFIFANVLTFTIRAECRKREKRLEKKVEPVAQIFMAIVILSIVGVWVVASLFADQIVAVSNEVLYISAIAMGTIALVVFSIFGWRSLRNDLIQSPLGIKVVQFSESDWFKAFIVFFAMPLVAVILGISYATQLIRKHSPLGKSLGLEEKELSFTKEVQWILVSMGQWEWGSILHKTIQIGAFWFIFVIGIGKAVNVFLSFLNELLAPLPLVVTTFIFIATGLGLFALPPVPGLPIYLTGGILLSQSAINSGFSFAAAGWYSVLISAVIKMLSVVMQQKFIGQILGRNSVAIRSACQLNSLELRAMKKIMAVPGWTVPKVAVLVGGPDWPTSVLTGLMGLPLLEMIWGSMPVIFTIIPVCFAGAVLIQEDNELLNSLSAVLLSLSLVVQLSPFFIAIHYIAKAAIDNEEELNNEPLDEEVRKYDEKNERKREWSFILNKWVNLSPTTRVFHIIMCFLSVLSNMTFLILSSETFESFEITDTIDDTLDGNPLNLVVMPLGGIMLGVIAITFVYLFIFGMIQSRRVNKRLADNVQMKEAERPKLEDLRFSSVRYYTDTIRSQRTLRIGTVHRISAPEPVGRRIVQTPNRSVSIGEEKIENLADSPVTGVDPYSVSGMTEISPATKKHKRRKRKKRMGINGSEHSTRASSVDIDSIM